MGKLSLLAKRPETCRMMDDGQWWMDNVDDSTMDLWLVTATMWGFYEFHTNYFGSVLTFAHGSQSPEDLGYFHLNKANTGPLNQTGYSRQILFNFHVFLVLPSICANLSLLQTQKVSRLMQEGNIDYLFTQPANQNDTRVLCDEDSMIRNLSPNPALYFIPYRYYF